MPWPGRFIRPGCGTSPPKRGPSRCPRDPPPARRPALTAALLVSERPPAGPRPGPRDRRRASSPARSASAQPRCGPGREPCPSRPRCPRLRPPGPVRRRRGPRAAGLIPPGLRSASSSSQRPAASFDISMVLSAASTRRPVSPASRPAALMALPSRAARRSPSARTPASEATNATSAGVNSGRPVSLQQREGSPAAQVAGKHGTQFVREPVRPAKLALPEAAVKIALGGLAEAGRRPRPAGQGGELVDVRLTELDLGQPGRRRVGEAVLHERPGGQQGCRIDGQQAGALERHRPVQAPAGRLGEAGNAEAAVGQAGHVAADPCANIGSGHHRPGVPATFPCTPRNLGWPRPAGCRSVEPAAQRRWARRPRLHRQAAAGP